MFHRHKPLATTTPCVVGFTKEEEFVFKARFKIFHEENLLS
jgi:hypothetical protein